MIFVYKGFEIFVRHTLLWFDDDADDDDVGVYIWPTLMPVVC